MPALYSEWREEERGAGARIATRLALVPGTHVIEAESRGERRAVRITVEAPPVAR